MVRINWTNQAKSDLKNIAEYISRDSVRYAKNQILRIRNRVIVLKNHPLSGRTVSELEDPQIRELIEASNRIINNIINENRIDILTVHHSSSIVKNQIS